MKKLMFVLMLLITVGFISCDSKESTVTAKESGFSLDSAKAAIATLNDGFGPNWAKGDSVAFGNAYTSDAQVYVPNMERLSGTSNIVDFFGGGYRWGIRGGKLTTDEVIGGPEFVAETGKYEITDSSGKTMDKGKYLALWKQENGKWKMYRDMWNSDLPMPGEPAK